MITKRLSGLLAVAVLLLVSCGKKNPSYTKYIPKESNYVVGIDVRSILEKLDKDSLSVEKIMTTFKDETSNEKLTKALDTYNQFKDAGIDWASRVYIAASLNGSLMGGGSFNGNVEAVAGMKDSKKFEEFLKKQPNTKDIKKGDGFSYTGDGDKIIGWNEDAVIFVTAQSGSSDDYMPDSLGNMSKPQSANNATASADLLKKFFKLDKKESISEAEGFGDLQSQKGDVVVYSQSGNMAKSFPFLAMVPKLADFMKGYSTSILNFENGKVVTESTGHLGKEAADFLKKYAGPEIDWSLVENYASSNVDGVVAFSFNPTLIPGLIQYLGFEGPANMGLQQAGLTLEETGKIFKGDFAVVVSDFAISRTAAQPGKDDISGMASSTMPTAKMVFVAKLGDKAVVEKLLKMATDRGLIVRNGNMIAPNPQMTGGAAFPYAISIANDQLTFASDAATLTAYQAKSGKITLPSGVESTLKGKAASAYVDVEKILAGISPTMFDSNSAAEQAVLNQAKATFKNGWYTFSNISGNSITSKAEFNLMSDKQNSLSQIIKFGIFAYQQNKIAEASRAKEMESMPADTSANGQFMDSLRRAEESRLDSMTKK